MPYQPVAFPGFGSGLNLRDKVDAVSEDEAIDALNVVFTERGAVKQRYGYTALTGSALTNKAASLEPFYTTGGTKQLLAGCGTRLEAISTAGAVVASATGLTDGTWDFARFGAPGSEYAYAGQGNDTLRRWDGAAWSSPASMPAGGALAVMAVDQGNRLVCGRFNTTTGGPSGGASTSNPSRVYFSDPGAPETWGVNNYVDFTPGDGEKVQGIIAWRELLFIFKESKFFIVYGTTTDASGNPVFQWRTIDSGVGLVSPRALCADEFGVYFMARDGVYQTNGGAPKKLSDLIDPIWLGGASSYYSGGVLAHANITNAVMTAHGRQIYLGFPTSTNNDRTLVYDPRYEWWSIWDTPACSLASFRISDQAELVFGDTTNKKIYRVNSSQTSDAGTAITSYWRSGWFDYDTTVNKTIRETKVWGSGKVYVGLSSDFSIGTGGLNRLDMVDATAATWGGTTWGSSTWATPVYEIDRISRAAVRGTVFSSTFYNSTLDQTWAVHRLAHHIREQRVPSVRRTDT